VTITRIVSGGQTGVDRGALDAAIAMGIEHGGWCPRGRRAEDGEIPNRYLVRELDSIDYAARTERNVVDSDATLLITRGAPTGGSALTARVAATHRRPLLHVDLDRDADPSSAIRTWLDANRIATLNVAGSRESNCPGIAATVRDLLITILS
jgi:hypothetical protein